MTICTTWASSRQRVRTTLRLFVRGRGVSLWRHVVSGTVASKPSAVRLTPLSRQVLREENEDNALLSLLDGLVSHSYRRLDDVMSGYR
jgi:hypothetical protein